MSALALCLDERLNLRGLPPSARRQAGVAVEVRRRGARPNRHAACGLENWTSPWLSDPAAYLALRTDRLVIIDEVQRVPRLFQALRGIIDERILKGSRVGHFLLLGSASIDLLKQLARCSPSRATPGDDATASRGGLCEPGRYPRYLVYPAHDYQAWRVSSIAQEKQRNPRLGRGKSVEYFVRIMKELNLPYPNFIDYAVPANRKCGQCPEDVPAHLEKYCGNMATSPQG